MVSAYRPPLKSAPITSHIGGPYYHLPGFLRELQSGRLSQIRRLMEPFILAVAQPIRLCGRLLAPGDRVTVYPGFGVYPLLDVPPNYGAVLGALASGALEPLSPSLSVDQFAAAVGLETPSPSSAPSCSRSVRRWGGRLHRARSGLTLLR